MRAFFTKIGLGYLSIGAVFAILLELSWSWSLITTLFTEIEVWFSVSGFIGLSFSILVHMIFEPLVRALFWLPSMLSLLSPESHGGFLEWTFAGFYQHMISIEVIK